MANKPGALVISLDFELHWGMRDHVRRDDAVYGRLPAARNAVTDMLETFTSRNIRATWAIVGFLFGSTRNELDADCRVKANVLYTPSSTPYVEAIGIDEEHDPEHLAGSLVDLIGRSAGQEVGSTRSPTTTAWRPGKTRQRSGPIWQPPGRSRCSRPGADQSGAAE